MTSEKTIMIVDDDLALGEMLSIVLESEGYRAVTCSDGLRAIKLFPTIHPDLVLLDIMLPGMNGIGVAKVLRETSHAPIVMLTAKTDTRDVVTGLEAGADDYIVKPFKNSELIARIKARLRFTPNPEAAHSGTGVIRRGDLVINKTGRVATKCGRDLQLTPLEFDLLSTLAQHEGEALTRGELLEKVWGYSAGGDTRLVNVHIQRLRQKIEDDPDNPLMVQTVRGYGYKFIRQGAAD